MTLSILGRAVRATYCSSIIIRYQLLVYDFMTNPTAYLVYPWDSYDSCLNKNKLKYDWHILNDVKEFKASFC